MHDKVTRLRQLLSEAVPRTPEPSPQEAAALKAFAIYEVNAPTPFVLEQTPKARAMREIMRIAGWYQWQGEIERALDTVGATTLGDLQEHELEDLLTRMRLLEDCVQNGTDAPDAPPAR